MFRNLNMDYYLITLFLALYFCYFAGTHDVHITRQRRPVLESKHSAELSAIDELLDKLRDENPAGDTNRAMDDDSDIEAVRKYLAETLKQRAMKKETIKKIWGEWSCSTCDLRRSQTKKNINN